MLIRVIKTCVVLALPVVFLGCQTLASKNSTGVVVARRAQIRSSTAVVAADLLQVNRGDLVDILESTDVSDPSDNTRKERWLRVKARDEDTTEGWIEARNVMPEDVLEAERAIYRAQFENSGKPRDVIDKIVEGKLGAFYTQNVLMDQPGIRDAGITAGQMIAATAATLKENVSVRRFVRFKVGDSGK